MIEGEMIHLTDREVEILRRAIMTYQQNGYKECSLEEVNDLSNKLQYYDIVSLRKEKRYGK